jgi:hypothetical protein
MDHYDKIKSLLAPHVDTPVFREFLLWILDDQKYGSLSETYEPQSLLPIRDLIDLCKTWISTGKKPPLEFWNLTIRRAAHYVSASIAFNKDKDTDIDYVAGFASWGGGRRTFPISNVREAQLDKLENLIKTNEIENDIYSWEDYEKS